MIWSITVHANSDLGWKLYFNEHIYWMDVNDPNVLVGSVDMFRSICVYSVEHNGDHWVALIIIFGIAAIIWITISF